MNCLINKIKLMVILFFVAGGLLMISFPPSTFSSAPKRDSNITDKIELGKALFFDKRLSSDKTISCATCHDPATAFADNNSIAVGIGGKLGVRNAPTLLNSALSKNYFWDGRADSLEEQGMHPLTNSSEMGMENYNAVVARVSAVAEYRKSFRKVFQTGTITIEMIVQSLAAYERTLVSKDAPFDKFLAGDENAISESQKRGWALFKGKANCTVCHAFNDESSLFTDFKFHNTGAAAKDKNLSEIIDKFTTEIVIPTAPAKTKGSNQKVDLPAHKKETSGLGRFLVTKRRQDIGAFKTPALRDTELTSPYMHDGSLITLLDVIRFYNKGGEANLYLDKEMRPLNLNEQEMNDLVEFLKSLTSSEILRLAQTTEQQTRE